MTRDDLGRGLAVVVGLLGVVLLLAVDAFGQPAPLVNPSALRVTAPQTNADGSPLGDLGAIEFCVSFYPSGPLVGCVWEPAPWTDPPALNATVTVPLTRFPLTADGLYDYDTRARDLVGNPSVRSIRSVPFERNVSPPSAPTGLEVVPAIP